MKQVKATGLHLIVDPAPAEAAAKELIAMGGEVLAGGERSHTPLDANSVAVNATPFVSHAFAVVLTAYMTVNATTKDRAPLW